MLLDESSVSLRLEGVLYVDRDSLCHNRLDGRRIDDFCSEVRKLEGCLVGDIADGSGCRNDFRIRSHHTRNVSPYLENAGFAADCIKGSGVVRSSASQSGGPALLVRSDEARKNEKLGDRICLHHFVHAEICLLNIHDVLVTLGYCADDLP